MTRAVNALSVIGLIALAMPAQSRAEQELDGMYLAEGINPGGGAYRGVVEIARHGDVHFVTWIMSDPLTETPELGLSSIGIALQDNGMLAVSYYTPDSAGLALYRIEDEGRRLVGKWTIVGDDGTVHTETLTRLSGALPPTRGDVVRDRQQPGKRVPAYSGATHSF